MSSLRQTLGLDQRPLSDQATEFAEALQAEAEQLLLATSSSGLSGGASEGNKKNGAAGTNAVKAAVLQAGQGQRDGRAGGDPNGNSVDNTTQKLRCKFWQTTVGCKRGEGCKFSHSWESADDPFFVAGFTRSCRKQEVSQG